MPQLAPCGMDDAVRVSVKNEAEMREWIANHVTIGAHSRTVLQVRAPRLSPPRSLAERPPDARVARCGHSPRRGQALLERERRDV